MSIDDGAVKTEEVDDSMNRLEEDPHKQGQKEAEEEVEDSENVFSNNESKKLKKISEFCFPFFF